MIVIIDYGMGNLRSVQKAFTAVGEEAIVTRRPEIIDSASHLVLPGVGAFPDCMANLDRYGLVGLIRKGIQSGKPFLGICLGLQLLFTESEEFGIHKGLDLIPGKVKRFPSSSGNSGQRLKVPHMGWNAVRVSRHAPPLQGLSDDTYMYFVHSYYVEPSDPSTIATTTEYGLPFVSSVWRDNVFACQFHPEKSQAAGLRIVKNFATWR